MYEAEILFPHSFWIYCWRVRIFTVSRGKTVNEALFIGRMRISACRGPLMIVLFCCVVFCMFLVSRGFTERLTGFDIISLVFALVSAW